MFPHVNNRSGKTRQRASRAHYLGMRRVLNHLVPFQPPRPECRRWRAARRASPAASSPRPGSDDDDDDDDDNDDDDHYHDQGGDAEHRPLVPQPVPHSLLHVSMKTFRVHCNQNPDWKKPLCIKFQNIYLL